MIKKKWVCKLFIQREGLDVTSSGFKNLCKSQQVDGKGFHLNKMFVLKIQHFQIEK